MGERREMREGGIGGDAGWEGGTRGRIVDAACAQ